MTLRDYLLKEHTEETVKIYLRDIRVFLDYLPEPKAEKATYQDIMNYVDHLRKQYQNPRTINRMLYGVKAWYHWLIQTGKRQDHPCRYLTLKDAKTQDIQLQDLFTESELELLMDRKERYESRTDQEPGYCQFIDLPGIEIKRSGPVETKGYRP
jgi:site-specific recombinase XerD